MKKTTLVLVPEASICDINDFHEIAHLIGNLAPDIVVHVVKRKHLWLKQWLFMRRPCLYVAFYEARFFRPIRGLCLHGRSMEKSAQYTFMQAAGIDVIPWQPIVPGRLYEEKDWGNPVIVKPDRGREGRDVRLSHPENIAYEKISPYGEAHLIQKFIETGDNPCYFRCLTLFGEVLYLRKTSNLSEELLDGLPNPVANAAHGKAELVIDAEVMAFAKKNATHAFPNIPLLGQDIVRDRTTGQLYCLEVNPYGSTWHFSTTTGLNLQKRDNIYYKDQFNAFNVAARVLIEKARHLAR
jgi:hypothetical protein